MPTIKLQWWLWNQMFEYALAYTLSCNFHEEMILDWYFLVNRFFYADWTFREFELDVFGISKTYSTGNTYISKIIHPSIFSFLKKIAYWNRYICEQNGRLISDFPPNSYLNGWFQSYKYFENYSQEIKEIFTVKTPMSWKNKDFLERISTAWDNSISLHVRRGDYVTLDGANKWHGICSLGYYETAIEFMIKKSVTPVFFIFSDDIAWCKENINFPLGVEVHYIDHNGAAWHEDLRLMYHCSHHIIANSSFSWWWAYLWKNPNKTVIAPSKWLQTDTFSTDNLIPKTWKLL